MCDAETELTHGGPAAIRADLGEVLYTRYTVPAELTPDHPWVRKAVEQLLTRVTKRTHRQLMAWLTQGRLLPLARAAGFAVYDIDRAEDKARYLHFDAPHNQKVLVALMHTDHDEES